MRKSGSVEQEDLARVQFQAGEQDQAIEAARNHVKNRKNEVLPLATLVELLWQAGKKDDAKQIARRAAGDQRLDRYDCAVLSPGIAPIAKECGYAEDWKVAAAPKSDTGNRPPLDSLGPFRWQPSPAATWSLKDCKRRRPLAGRLSGKPVVRAVFPRPRLPALCRAGAGVRRGG